LHRRAGALGGYGGKDAHRAPMHWQRELLDAVDDLQRITRAAERGRRAV